MTILPFKIHKSVNSWLTSSQFISWVVNISFRCSVFLPNPHRTPSGINGMWNMCNTEREKGLSTGKMDPEKPGWAISQLCAWLRHSWNMKRIIGKNSDKHAAKQTHGNNTPTLRMCTASSGSWDKHLTGLIGLKTQIAYHSSFPVLWAFPCVLY